MNQRLTFAYLFCLTLAAWSMPRVMHSDELVSVPAGTCSLTAELQDSGSVLRLRAKRDREYCDLTSDLMKAAIRAALDEAAKREVSGLFSSLSIGRMIDFPWLSRYLADTASADPAWDLKRGRPMRVDINRYVANLLSDRLIIAQIEGPFQERGYAITGASVEKVLVGHFRDLPLQHADLRKGRVPYDAQVWFRIRRLQRAD